MWVYYLYDTGLKEVILRLGAFRSSECWAEGAQTAALIDKFWLHRSQSGRRMEEKAYAKSVIVWAGIVSGNKNKWY